MAFQVNCGCPTTYGDEGAASGNGNCCVPCGSCAYPGRRQMYTHEYLASKRPLTDMLETNRQMALRINMENKSHARKIHDNAKFKMEQHLSDTRMDLEYRRDKLKTMLEDEDECFRREIINRFESRQASKIDEMRTRVGILRAQREEHQKKFVEQKLDQAFQNQCEQMRTLLSKRMTREIAKDWDEQLVQKQRLECEEQEEERMWAELNNLDVAEKIKREEHFQAIRDAAARRGLEELNKQVEYKKLKQADREKIKNRELAMIEADWAAMKAERQKLIDEKALRFSKAKAHVKDMMETRDYYRDRKLKREEIVAREFLKKAVRELYVEQEDRNKKKRDLMRAIEIYRDYLQKRDCLENAKEEALQRIIDGVIEEQHEKVMASRKREHEQRRQLFHNVMAGRALQVADLDKKRELEEEERLKDMILLKEDWKRYLRDLDEEKRERTEKQEQYRSDLDCQVLYNEKIHGRERAEVKREDELCEVEEKLFNNRLKKTLQEAQLTMSNPYRQPLVGKNVRQCLRPV